MFIALFRAGPADPRNLFPPPAAGLMVALNTVTDAVSRPVASINRAIPSHDELTSPRKRGSGSIAVFEDRYQLWPRSVVSVGHHSRRAPVTRIPGQQGSLP
jgi:hypothetical protein